eukprot:TRINITY_DN39679_c0_g2_i1.p1 TRINITY_DN39679_c0_g2~~TRINITY_DN39679_c0_g2_i1.p1  ORF type:complete len:493 (-),score=97.32 TRINITY_DN39679_c0_g2_i1:78-1556(-)
MEHPPVMSASEDQRDDLIGWLREEDAALIEEDSERNVEQAERNAKMRERLLARKRNQKENPEEKVAVDFEEFMGVTNSANTKGVADETQPPWFIMRPHIDNTLLRLHEEILDFVAFMKHTPKEKHARRDWVQTVTTACKAMWPDCKVRVFGSFYTGLSLPNADVDVAVLGVPCKPVTGMKMLAEHMLAKGKISWLELIESAKVPVAKVRSQESGLRADVVFNMSDGIETSEFIRQRMKEYPPLKPLLIFLKYFLLQRGLHETYTGGMGSYLLCNVVLHFLQRHPATRDAQKYAATSLGHYLFDFFKYWGQEFRYESQAISVNDGGRVFNRSEREKGKGKWKSKGISICLESPATPSVDLGSAAYRMSVLRNLFHHAFHCLSHNAVSCSPPEVSLLCPLLLDPAHAVITQRYALMAEQPVALVGLKRANESADDDDHSAKIGRIELPIATEEDGVADETEEDAVGETAQATPEEEQEAENEEENEEPELWTEG